MSEVMAPVNSAAAPLEASNDRLAEYLLHPTDELLAAICAEYAEFVRKVVAKVSNPIPYLLSYEDLVSYGMIGLLGAISRYDASKGTFRTWAYKKIQGAALDAIRRMSSNSRTRSVTIRPFTDYEQEEGVIDPTEGLNVALPDNASVVVRAAILSLPGAQSIIMLLLANGLRVTHISSLLSMPLPKVRSERRLAMLYLRDYLAEHLEDI